MKKLIRNILLGLILFDGVSGCSEEKQTYLIITTPSPHRTSPKNVIIMIADGGGFNHYKSADYYDCNSLPCQSYESFPVRLAMSTYPYRGSYDANLAWSSFNYLDKGATDSAAAATAMATGVKTFNAGLGVDINKKPVLNLVERAEQSGKSTGVVTSVPFSHATPAGFVVHNPARDDYRGIARQMINTSPIEVVMGCGNPNYDAAGRPMNNADYKYIDSADWSALKKGTAGGDADGDGVSDYWTLVRTRAEFQTLANGTTPKRVFGVAQVFETLQQSRLGNSYAEPYSVPFIQTVPTLAEMTNAALNVLDNNPDGFFIMIEGGAVDWAAHNNQSGRMIEEMNDFNNSVEAVIRWIDTNSSWDETLVIITADHETGHLTGPGSGKTRKDIISNGPGKVPAMEWHSRNHTNSLVPFFAKGPGAEKFFETIDGDDPVCGPYIDNTDIANTILTLWAGK